MRLEIFSTVAQQILAHAHREAPREACGLLLGRDGRVEAAVPAGNVAVRPEQAFEVDPETLLRAHRAARNAGCALLGWYHSHPNGRAEPSACDAERAVESGRIWLIAAGDALWAFRSVERGAIEGRFEALDLDLIAEAKDVGAPGSSTS